VDAAELHGHNVIVEDAGRDLLGPLQRLALELVVGGQLVD
jgi:hypothetical protein